MPSKITRPDGYEALPKRFKEYITRLEDDIDALRAAVPSQQPTDTYIHNYLSKEVGYLPDATTIEFMVHGATLAPDGSQVFHDRSARLRVSRDRNRSPSIEVYCEDAVFVVQETSNVAHIVPRKFAWHW